MRNHRGRLARLERAATPPAGPDGRCPACPMFVREEFTQGPGGPVIEVDPAKPPRCRHCGRTPAPAKVLITPVSGPEEIAAYRAGLTIPGYESVLAEFLAEMERQGRPAGDG